MRAVCMIPDIGIGPVHVQPGARDRQLAHIRRRHWKAFPRAVPRTPLTRLPALPREEKRRAHSQVLKNHDHKHMPIEWIR